MTAMTSPFKSKRKRFDPKSYQRSDRKAKDCITKYLKSLGHTVLATKEDYSVDLTSTLNGVTYKHEVEMKHVWDGEWPSAWKDVNIPFRKKRLLTQVYGSEDSKDIKFYFYIIRGDCKKAWKMDALIVQNSPVVEVPNRAVRKGEYFFKVPVAKAELIDLGVKDGSKTD